jgi:hypothetical protein
MSNWPQCESKARKATVEKRRGRNLR